MSESAAIVTCLFIQPLHNTAIADMFSFSRRGLDDDQIATKKEGTQYTTINY